MRIREAEPGTNPLLSSCFRRHTLASVLDESKVGVVICDRQLRYKALNQSVAEIHNEPVKAHLGQPMRQILGNFADEIVPHWESVLSSGHSSTNLEIVGKLPKRSGMGRWVENLFPLKDARGRVEHVGCFVIEIILTPLSASPRSTSLEKNKTRSANQASRPEPGPRVTLSHREQEVLRLLAEGKTTKQIASTLQISSRTVETYRGRLMLKLQADSMVKLVHYAIQNCIIKL
ncbi:MAG TPA: LuxR C-terminal-related transcriptional regulator [Candidatus Acidoferrales bacterium]|jgi:DNA-binding CsgD family transcriptional regulator|nr:LuxR C-terminal-related transcriptional regulator [Candidatus Acidoferrales bacterium]